MFLVQNRKLLLGCIIVIREIREKHLNTNIILNINKKEDVYYGKERY